MKILLTNLPWIKDGFFGVRAGSRWPHIKDAAEGQYMPFPFYLAYAASLLKEHDFDVRLYDALAENVQKQAFIDEVSRKRYDLIVVETSTASLENDLEILKRLKDANTKIALCGPDIHIRKPGFLINNDFIDFVLVGEYEYTVLELARYLNDVKEVHGLIYRDFKDGRIKINSPRSLISNLDKLPWPMREGLQMSKYLDAPGDMPLPSVQMIASRGCPFKCKFCAWPQLMYQDNSYRTRSIVDVVDEMEHLVKKLKFKSVYFDDDTFNIGKERMLRFANELIERNNQGRINVPWAMMARADLMDEEILMSLRASGLHAVKYGIESSNPRLLEEITKDMDIEKASQMVKFSNKLGIKTHLTFTFGLPKENWITIIDTVKFALKHNPDSVQFSITTPFPGTSYHDFASQNKLMISNRLSDYDGNSKSVIKTKHMRARELECARNLACHIWNFYVRIRNISGKIFKKDHSPHSYIIILRKFFKEEKLSTALPKLVRFLRPSRLKRHYLEMMGIKDTFVAYKGPDFLHIDITNRCNNSCIGCWCNSPLLKDKQIEQKEKDKILPYELLVKIMDEAKKLGTRRIAFGGGGEPMMHPDFLKLIKYATSKGLECYSSTNLLLASNNILEELMRSKLQELSVSVWAATDETYRKLHPDLKKGTFDDIMSRLVYLNSNKKILPKVKICNVITKLNFFEIEQMLDFAIKTKSEIVEFTVIDVIPERTETLLLDNTEREALLESCERIKKNEYVKDGRIKISNFDLFIRRVASPSSELGVYDKDVINDIPCYAGWTFSRICANGDVNFCLKSHRMPVGNIYTERFTDIWNSSFQKELRKRALTDRSGSYFYLTGNGNSNAVGCEKVCDDLVRNMYTHDKVMSLTFLEKKAIGILSKIYKKSLR